MADPTRRGTGAVEAPATRTDSRGASRAWSPTSPADSSPRDRELVGTPATAAPSSTPKPAPTPAAEAAAAERTTLTTGVSPLRRLSQMVMLLWLVSELLVGLRVVFKAVNANPDAGFVSFIYGIAGPLVAPFTPMVRNHHIGDGLLETGAVIAMLVFLAAALIVIVALRIVSPARPRKAV